MSRPRPITRLKIVTSMFPPETTQIVFFPATGALLNIAAATETAPAPSAISFCCSINASMAAQISSSVTVTIPSTYLLHNSNVCSPRLFYCNAIGYSRNGWKAFTFGMFDGTQHTGSSLRLDTIYFYVRLQRLQGIGYP